MKRQITDSISENLTDSDLESKEIKKINRTFSECNTILILEYYFINIFLFSLKSIFGEKKSNRKQLSLRKKKS